MGSAPVLVAAALAGAFYLHGDSRALSRCDMAQSVGVAQYDGNNPNEDRHAVRRVGSSMLAVTVLDGHGGGQVAHYLSKELLQILENHLGGAAMLGKHRTSSLHLNRRLVIARPNCSSALRMPLFTRVPHE